MGARNKGINKISNVARFDSFDGLVQFFFFSMRALQCCALLLPLDTKKCTFWHQCNRPKMVNPTNFTRIFLFVVLFLMVDKLPMSLKVKA